MRSQKVRFLTLPTWWIMEPSSEIGNIARLRRVSGCLGLIYSVPLWELVKRGSRLWYSFILSFIALSSFHLVPARDRTAVQGLRILRCRTALPIQELRAPSAVTYLSRWLQNNLNRCLVMAKCTGYSRSNVKRYLTQQQESRKITEKHSRAESKRCVRQVARLMNSFLLCSWCHSSAWKMNIHVELVSSSDMCRSIGALPV